MIPCHLIIHEKTGRWAAALRATRGSRLPTIIETRSFAACRQALSQSPYAILPIEACVSNCQAVQSFIVDTARRFPRAVFIGLLTPEASAAELLLREAGAIDVLRSALEVPRLARVAARFAAQVPGMEQPLEQFVADILPWPGFATREWLAATG